LTDVLGARALNRALLARQLLLERSDLAIPAAIEHLVGLQAQSPQAPYVGLWSRLQNFDPGALSKLLGDRRVVRATVIRGTIHLVTTRDYLALRPTVDPVLERVFNRNVGYLAGLDPDDLVAAGQALLEEQPRTRLELGRALHARWPQHDEHVMSLGVTYRVPLVQLPPRGLWRASGPATWATAESWLGQPLGRGIALKRLALRYLAAYGPARVDDLRVWSGLTQLRDVVESLRPQLRVFHDEDGRELFDLPDAPLPHPDTPAPVRFVPEYDNLLLSHADRSHVIKKAYREALFTKGAVLVDGFVVGAWKIVRRPRATLDIEHFERLAKSDASAVAEEGDRLLAFTAAEGDGRDDPAPPHDVWRT
jgi:hypothetical protein